MRGISAKIKKLWYPFDQPLQVVLWGNNALHVQGIHQAIQKAMTEQGGALAEIRSLSTGVQISDEEEDIFYFRNDSLANLVKFQLHTVTSIDQLSALSASVEIDVLLICLSFSDTDPDLHDESVKYDLEPVISKSRRYSGRKAFVLVVNRSLFNEDATIDPGVMDKLAQSVKSRDFSKLAKKLNTKGVRQLPLACNYIQSYHPALGRKAGGKRLGVVVSEGEALVNEDNILLLLYNALLESDRFSRSTITQY